MQAPHSGRLKLLDQDLWPVHRHPLLSGSGRGKTRNAVLGVRSRPNADASNSGP